MVRDGKHMMTDISAAHSRRIGRADEGADRCAGNGCRLHTHVVERLEYRDVGEPTRTTAPERQREAPHAPAWRAKSQALAASGATSAALAAANVLVAVPSRTRPAIPWRMAAMRKKLYAK